MKKRKLAFTLAEVLTVIAIIGIVTAVVTHTLVADVGERVNSNRELNISQKITKAVEMMAIKGDYDRFPDTIDFVRGLSKYLKMVKICDSEHIAECWPSEKVVTAEGVKYEVKNAKTGATLHTGYTSNTAAFVMADGAAVLMSFNPAAPIPNKKIFKSVGEGKELPMGDKIEKIPYYYSEAMNAIDFVMDVNGAEGPNSETEENGTYHDIRSYRIAAFSVLSPNADPTAVTCNFYSDGLCGVITNDYSPLDCTDSENAEFCLRHDGPFAIDYQAGAQKACKDMGLTLPPVQTLMSIVSAETAINNVPDGTYMTSTSSWFQALRKSGSTVTNVVSPNSNSQKFPAICAGQKKNN